MDRFCGACDPFFRNRRDLVHTYEAPGCRLARPGSRVRAWTPEERRAHDFVAEVERLLKEGPPKSTTEWYEELMAP